MEQQQSPPHIGWRASRANQVLNVTLLLVVLMLLFGLLMSGTACGKKDTTPPAAPTNLSYEIVNDNTMLVFSWEPATDKSLDTQFYLVRTSWEDAISEYWNYVGASTSFWANAPRTSGTYTFQVKTVDKAYNESEPTSLEFQWN